MLRTMGDGEDLDWTGLDWTGLLGRSMLLIVVNWHALDIDIDSDM